MSFTTRLFNRRRNFLFQLFFFALFSFFCSKINYSNRLLIGIKLFSQLHSIWFFLNFLLNDLFSISFKLNFLSKVLVSFTNVLNFLRKTSFLTICNVSVHFIRNRFFCFIYFRINFSSSFKKKKDRIS